MGYNCAESRVTDVARKENGTMALSTERFGKIEPSLLPCRDRSWLAVSSPGAPLKIGVAAPSEQVARQRFDEAVKAWSDLWDNGNE